MEQEQAAVGLPRSEFTSIDINLSVAAVAQNIQEPKKEQISMPNITVINPFEVPHGKENEALTIWDKVAEFMRRQPGFVSAKLHRSVDPKAKFYLVTVAE